MDKPILLLDVDGVLNVFGFSMGDDALDNGGMGPTDASVRLERVFEAPARHRSWTIRFPAGVTDRMARLNEVFECVWATTWEGDARTGIAPALGVGQDWPVIKLSDSNAFMSAQTWKLPSVSNWIEANAGTRKVAWVDDDLCDDAFNFATNRPNTLFVRAFEQTGLDEAIEHKLIEWANAES